MTTSGETVSEPRSISWAAFECLVIVMFLVLSISEMAVDSAVSRALGPRFDGSWIGILLSANLVLARVAVDGILKGFGLSRSGKTLEVRGHTVVSPEGLVGDDEVVEVHLPGWFARSIIWVLPTGCLFFAATGTLMLERDPWIAALSYLLSGFSGLCAIVNWGDRRPQAWANRDGIAGYPSGFHPYRRFVPWSDVATCEIETFYNTFGEPVLIRPTLKGSNGESLMRMNLLHTRMEDQDRLVKYIKAKLPKPKVDPWE